MKPEELFRELKEGKTRPIYYLFGEEDYLKKESVERLKESVLKSGMKDFNCDIFYGGETDIARVISASQTLPVMAPLRLVNFLDADKMKGAEEEALMAYLENPSPTTVLLLVGKSVDKRKKLFKSIEAVGASVEHSRPYENEMTKWIKWIAKKKGLVISGQASRHLVDIIGNDLKSIENEIEKASLYAGERKDLRAEDFEAVSVDIKARTVFQLIDSMGRKDLADCLMHLKKLLDNGENPILILSMILRQLRLIWIGLDTLRCGGKEDDVKKKVKLPPFVFREYRKQIKMFAENELRKAYKSLYELDLKFKSSRIDKEKAIELLLFRLCGH